MFSSYLLFSFACFQPLARMGATVTGVDAVEKNIKIARLHAVWSFYDLDCDFLVSVCRDEFEK